MTHDMRALVIGGSGFEPGRRGRDENPLTAAPRASVERLVFTSSLGAMGLPANEDALDESCHFDLKPFRSAVEHPYEWYRENGYIRQPNQ